MSQSKSSKYLQRQLSSFSDSFKRILLPSKSFSQSSHRNHDSHLDLAAIYDLCLILKDMILQLGARAIIHDFLLMLYAETSQKSPDLSYVINWIKSRFWILILEQDAELLLEYMKLFHPLTSENLSEYDGFLNMLDKDPLLLYLATDPSHRGSSKPNPLPSKEDWCEKMSIFVKERAGELFWDRAKLKPERKVISQKFRSFTRLVSGNFQSNKVTPIPPSMNDKSLSPVELEEEITNRKFIRQKSMFEPNALRMERVRADSDSFSIKGQRSLQAVDFINLHHPHALTLSAMGETKSDHQDEQEKTSSFQTSLGLPSSQFKDDGCPRSMRLFLEDV